MKKTYLFSLIAGAAALILGAETSIFSSSKSVQAKKNNVPISAGWDQPIQEQSPQHVNSCGCPFCAGAYEDAANNV